MLEARDLTKTYGNHHALRQLNLSVDKGEIFCLLGQNGAGKTTTLNLFLGLIAPTSGEAVINGITVKPNSNKTTKMIAYIPEVVQLYGNLSGIENLDFFSRLAGFTYSNKDLSDFLIKAGLQKSAHQNKISSYSKGMRQKVGIAIALSKNAEYIIMDEPISGLDPKATQEFTKICKELSAEGKAIIMATHDIFNAVNVGTKIGIMKEGKLVHTSDTGTINATELQDLYLKTI
ncbi:ATP-binding cassette domain-containing protein [Aquimarina sp. ERC-38]|uniref:ABC transporter ATP-binding protein n=1 Tax=Aquimarina sp. ERC-38 TaxID=2949996 RepID=UPI0022473248|nr:ATP-binding cassette domain-containing protein [Aquimarina sp. ERC-38]UZO80710.1 ATP-binding cassette domain-containing protein [Aquimarina sp. ERC-38]